MAAFAVHSERMSDGRLHAEAIQHRAENFVVVEAIDQRFVQRHFIGHGSVNHALIQIGGAQSPDLAGEHDVVAVVHFGKVIKRAGLLGIRNGVSAAIVLDGDVAFFDIDIGRAVFAHGAELDQVAIGLKLAQCEEQIQRAHDVVHLREHRMFAVDHGIGSGALFGEMDDGFRLESPG